MKNSLKRLNGGFSQVFLLLAMLLVAVSLPLATRLVQNSQENRGRAASSSSYSSGDSCASGSADTCIGNYLYCCSYNPDTGSMTWNSCGMCQNGVHVTPTRSASGCDASTAGDLRCNGDVLQMCFWDAGESTSDWGTYRDCGNSGCSSGACNSNECEQGEHSCTGTEVEYCSGSGLLITNTCQYGCGTDGWCAGAACTSGTHSCSSDVASVCIAGKWTTTSCENGCGIDGYCAESACSPSGQTQCQNGYLYRCDYNPDFYGNAWVNTGYGCECSDDDARCVEVGDSAQLQDCSMGSWRYLSPCSGGCNSDATGCYTSDYNSGGGSSPSDDDGSEGGSSTVPVTAIELSPTTLVLRVGESAVITATLTPVGSTDKLTWSTDDATVATVTNDGLVTGVAIGETVIRAVTSNGIEATVSVKVIPDDDLTLSFKIAFAGIKPYYKSGIGNTYSCISELGDLTVEVLNKSTNTYESHSDVQVAVVGNQVDSSGNQVFQVTNLEIGSEFASVDTSFNNIKIKGPFHLKRRMCLDGQSGRVEETTVCDIDLTSSDYVYDFTEYAFVVGNDKIYGLLAGDVNQDGIINSQDFSYVKNAWDADAEPECGRKYDLNLDGVVNHIDKQLVLTALSFKDDE